MKEDIFNNASHSAFYESLIDIPHSCYSFFRNRYKKRKHIAWNSQKKFSIISFASRFLSQFLWKDNHILNFTIQRYLPLTGTI